MTVEEINEPAQGGNTERRKKMSNRLTRLKRLHAMALGLYMARRIIGESAEVQKRRLLRLAERITIEECYGTTT